MIIHKKILGYTEAGLIKKNTRTGFSYYTRFVFVLGQLMFMYVKHNIFKDTG